MVCAISHAGIESEIEAYVEKVSNGFRPAIPQQWPEPLRHLVEDCWAQDPVSRHHLAGACMHNCPWPWSMPFRPTCVL